MKPTILTGGFTKADIDALRAKRIWREIDLLERQLAELYEVEHADRIQQDGFDAMRAETVKEQLGSNPELLGCWVYYPWSGELIHMANPDDYQKLRTNRNRNLITADEQTKLESFPVAIAGMSVGGGMAVSLAYSGIGNLRIADLDVLETSNLNRVRAGAGKVGMPKLDIITDQIYEINPFAEISRFEHGLTQERLAGFLKKPLGMVFEQIDDFEMKVRLRLEAKQAGVPVIMLTSLGDNVLIDVERYDLDANTPIFNGLLGDLPDEILTKPVGEKEKVKYAAQIVGIEHVPTRALGSLLEINQTLVGRPQLYSTIAIDGGLAAFLAKRLALGWDLPSGRSYLSLEAALNLPKADDAERAKVLEQLREMTNGK